VLREVRKLRFADLYERWRLKRVTQREAARALGMSARTFRCWTARYEAVGPEGLEDRRSLGGSHLRAPESEREALESLYAEEYAGWNARHFWERYREAHGGRGRTLGRRTGCRRRGWCAGAGGEGVAIVSFARGRLRRD